MRKLGKDIAIYGITNTIYVLVQFITMPLAVKSMNMEEIAHWNILLPTCVLLAAITTLGMDSSVARFLADSKSDLEKKKLFSTGFVIVISLSLIIGIVMYFATPYAMKNLNLPDSEMSSYRLMLAWLIGVVLNQYCLNWLKFTFQRSAFIFLMFLQSIVYLGMILAFRYLDTLSVTNIMWALVISQGLNAIVGMVINRKLFVKNFPKQLLKRMIRYGLPAMMIVFGMNLLVSLDRYILQGYVTKEAFAIYTQAIRICAIMSMLVSSFNFAFLPSSMSIINEEDAGATFSKFHSYYLLTMTFFGLGFIACGKLAILLLAGAEYLPAFKYFPFLVFVFILYGLYSFAQMGIVKSKKLFFGLYVVLAGILLAFAIDIILVSSIGGFGCVIGLLVALMGMLIMANVISKKNLIIPYALKKDIILIIYFIGMAALFCYFDFSKNLYWDSVFKFAILFTTIFPILMLLFKEEKNKILVLLMRRSKPIKS